MRADGGDCQGVAGGREMKAEELTGRELDVAVAEKVFGWKLGRPWGYQYRGWYPPESYKNGTPGDAAVIEDAAAPLAADSNRHAPHYSRNWAGVWAVVDEMRRRKWGFRVESWGDEWKCELCGARVGADDVKGYGPTAAVAICRAVLIAMGAAK